LRCVPVSPAHPTARTASAFADESPSVSEAKETEVPPAAVIVALASMVALSPEVGTWAGDQFAALNQFPSDPPPVQVSATARAEEGAKKLAARMAVSGKNNRREKVRVLGATADVPTPLLLGPKSTEGEHNASSKSPQDPKSAQPIFYQLEMGRLV
jgi:hypothetical protein